MVAFSACCLFGAGLLKGLQLKRATISKKIRFSIFARDNFTCRYCGQQSDNVVLVVDHVIPVCKGGTNDPDNLIASCEACNQGKGGILISQSAPSETDRLRLSQELGEQKSLARAIIEAAKAKEEIRQTVCDFWCELTGRDAVDRNSLSIVATYFSEFGEEVYSWIEIAAAKCGQDDCRMGKYISGIRRTILAERDGE